MTQGAVLILGARSDIARAVAHHFAALGHPIQLAARDAETLAADRTDLALRYSVPVSLHEFDVLSAAGHDAFLDALPELPSIAVCAVGLLGDQATDEQNATAAILIMRTNYIGPASIFALLAGRFMARGSGTLVGISSVAGERGRASNYVYGSAKAGFTSYLSGLRNRLAGHGVHVVTVLPGFVATQMTEHMQLPARLTAQPDDVARSIVRAVGKGKDVIYVRPVWRLIMAVIRAIPERAFKRLNF